MPEKFHVVKAIRVHFVVFVRFCCCFFLFFSVVGLLFCVGVLQYQLESCVIFSSLLSSTCALSHQHGKAKGNHDLCGTYSPISDKRAWGGGGGGGIAQWLEHRTRD